MRLDDKKRIIADLQDRFQRAKVVILTDYKGLDVAAINELRHRLKEVAVDYKVVKNTLLERASQGTGVEAIKESFVGPSAIALSYDDPVAPAKVLKTFADENDKLEIKIGVLEGKPLTLEAIKALASLPPREVLLAQLLSAMNAVPTSLVFALSDIPRRLVNVLGAVRDQKEAA